MAHRLVFTSRVVTGGQGGGEMDLDFRLGRLGLELALPEVQHPLRKRQADPEPIPTQKTPWPSSTATRSTTSTHGRTSAPKKPRMKGDENVCPRLGARRGRRRIGLVRFVVVCGILGIAGGMTGLVQWPVVSGNTSTGEDGSGKAGKKR